jgi:2-C-methyl-D-erythritol 4-phosphate cytidylyltransferase
VRLVAGGPKAFAPLAGRRLLDWSLDAFARARTVGAVIVAVPAGHEDAVAVEGVATVAGGASRSESVAAALAGVESELVAVHDAARPLVTAELIDELVSALAERPRAAAVIAAAPVTDTVKLLGEGGDGALAPVTETLDRARLRAAQTPQVFRTDALRAALEAAGDLAAASDDAMLVEAAGGEVLVHASPAANLKVTTSLDLRVAELLLGERRGA